MAIDASEFRSRNLESCYWEVLMLDGLQVICQHFDSLSSVHRSGGGGAVNFSKPPAKTFGADISYRPRAMPVYRL